MPYGLLDEVHRKDAQAEPQLKLKHWYTQQKQVMKMVHERLPTLPPGELYNDETWEWTIVRSSTDWTLVMRLEIGSEHEAFLLTLSGGPLRLVTTG